MTSTATNTNIDPNVVVNTALIEKVTRLEQEVLELRSQLGKARDHSIESLGFLRLHQAIVLFTGDDIEKFNHSIASELGSDYLHNLHRHLFCLSDAPLDKKIIETFRTSLKGCNVKW
jgi:hypothetical protein